MTPIATYVFLDLETTSLPHLELNKTRITELSMVAVKRNHVLDTRRGAVPRVVDKFTMCFNPRRMIDPGSTEASGLDNDLLEYQTDFNINVFNTINSFLQCLQKPICLVAQNGHSFDFPILKNHFEKLKVSLSDDVLCADSLYAFYDILEGVSSNNTNGNASLLNKANAQSTVAAKTANNQEALAHQTPDVQEKKKEDIIPEAYNNISNTIIEGEITDPKQTLDLFDDLQNQNLFKQQNETTPRHTKKCSIKTDRKKSKVSRKIFYEDRPKPKVSYKLKDIYERVQGCPGVEAHRAENDCVMAMEISISLAKQFVEWVDENHLLFSEVKPMRPGVPLGLLVLTGVLWGCTNPFIRQGTKGLRDVTATTWAGQAWAEVTFLLGNWKYVLPWLVNQGGSLSYLAAVQKAPLSVAVPTANSLAFVFTAITGVAIGVDDPLDKRSIMGIIFIMMGTALCCYDTS